ADRGHHLVARLGQQADQPLAQQRQVLGDHNSHGITARSLVGPPAGLSTSRLPPSASTRWPMPPRPEPGARTAPPRPSSATSTARLPFSRPIRTVASRAPECLATLVSASATT